MSVGRVMICKLANSIKFNKQYFNQNPMEITSHAVYGYMRVSLLIHGNTIGIFDGLE